MKEIILKNLQTKNICFFKLKICYHLVPKQYWIYLIKKENKENNNENRVGYNIGIIEISMDIFILFCEEIPPYDIINNKEEKK